MRVIRANRIYEDTPEQREIKDAIRELGTIIRTEGSRELRGEAPKYEGGLAAAQARLTDLRAELARVNAEAEAARTASQRAAAAERERALAYLDDRAAAEQLLRDRADAVAAAIPGAVESLRQVADKWWSVMNAFEAAAARWGIQTFPSDVPENPLTSALLAIESDAVNSRGEPARDMVGAPASLAPLPKWLEREPGPTLEQREAARDERGRAEARQSRQAAAARNR